MVPRSGERQMASRGRRCAAALDGRLRPDRSVCRRATQCVRNGRVGRVFAFVCVGFDVGWLDGRVACRVVHCVARYVGHRTGRRIGWCVGRRIERRIERHIERHIERRIGRHIGRHIGRRARRHRLDASVRARAAQHRSAPDEPCAAGASGPLSARRRCFATVVAVRAGRCG
ncbi:putative bapA protein [Burkholderia pseudomallei]|nr:putative bapA protein [Burkholderia pseudomallei]